MKSLMVAGAFLLAVTTCFAQTETIPKGYAIVVGAYAKSKSGFALKYTEHVSDLGYKARLGLNRGQSLIYVYIDITQNFKEAIALMREMRQKEQFGDTWVYVNTDEQLLTLPSEDRSKTDNTSTAIRDDSLPPADANKGVNEKAEMTKSAVTEESEKEELKEEREGDTLQVHDEQEAIEVKNEEEAIEVEDDRLNVMFVAINAANSDQVAGEVQVIDTERAKLLDVVKTNDYYSIDDPKNGSGRLTVIADIFGFRKMQREFNYYEPFDSPTNAELDSTEQGMMVLLDMVRYHKGDIITMYNVFYYKDAAIMRPESQYEVNSLLKMMEENPKYRIKIHGHVNGNNSGPIIGRGEGDFYGLDEGKNSQGYGSAKELSKQRAETIREFLIENGVAGDRMEVKAWGGKRMLYDKNSPKARENVRVEIEILDE